MKGIKFFLATLFLCLNIQVFAQAPRLILQTGNTGRVDRVLMSDNGKFLVSGFGTEIVHLWDVPSGRIRDTFIHDARVTDIDFSPVDNIIYVSTTAGSIYSWKFLGEEEHKKISAHIKGINNIALSPDGSILFSCGNDSTLIARDADTFHEIYRIKEDYNPFQVLTVSNKEPWIFAADRFGNLLLFDYAGKQVEYYGPILNTEIRDMDFDPGSGYLYMADNKGNIHISNTSPLKLIQTNKAFQFQAFSISIHDSLVISTGRDTEQNIRIWKFTGPDSLIAHEPGYIREDQSDPGFLYGIYDHAVAAGYILALPMYNGRLILYDMQNQRIIKTLQGQASPVNSVMYTHDNLVFASDRLIGTYDLRGFSDMKLHSLQQPVQKLMAEGEDHVLVFDQVAGISIFNPENGEIIQKKQLPGHSRISGIAFIPDKNQLIYRKDEKKVFVENLSTGKTKRIKIKNCSRLQLSADHRTLVLQSGGENIEVYETARFKETHSIKDRQIRAFAISRQGRHLAYHTDPDDNKSIVIVDIEKNNTPIRIPVSDSITIDRMVFGPHNQMLFTYARSVGKFNQKEDHSISCWDIETHTLKKRLTGHKGFINDLTFTHNGEYMISAGMDGSIRLWTASDPQEKLMVIPFNNGEWVAITPDGRFDSSPRAMSKIHFIFRNEMLRLDQMKRNFYEPGLVQKILGFSEEPLITRLTHNFELYPEIKLTPPQINEGFLGIDMKDRGGGIGPVSIMINDKEVLEDIRSLPSYDSSEHHFEYNVTNHPYLKKGELNKISVEGYNEKGYRISKKRSVYMIDNRKRSETRVPHLYAVVVGISDYKGELIDLNFAAKDASDFSKVIRMGAEKYLGKDHVHISCLTTDSEEDQRWPTKQNIEDTFLRISTEAQPDDILLVYLSGHGLDLENDDEFYFLTAGAENPDVKDRKSLTSVSLSSSELVHMIKLVPALKQLMIVDACHSGNLVASPLASNGRLNAKSVKALEFMKDRTGTYILASSEGKEVSYESDALNQGLLTYSLLFGLKGAGLHEGEMIDVGSLLHFVNRNVPELASDIGRTQKPVIKMPIDNTSFQIGRLSTSEREQIHIAPPKPIVIRSHFQEDETFYDDEELSSRLDAMIRELRDQSEHSFIFLDEGQFSNAYSIYGRYSRTEDGYRISYRIFRNDLAIFQKTFNTPGLSNAIENISQQLMTIIAENN